MAVRSDLVEVFSTCIDRLNEGETLEAILSDYPDLSNQLRPMLTAGLLFPRAHYPAIEVEQGQEAIEPAVEQAIRDVFGGGLSGGTIGILSIMVIVGIGVGLLLFALQSSTPSEHAFIVDVTATDSIPTATATNALTETPIEPTASQLIPSVTPTITITTTDANAPATNTAIPTTVELLATKTPVNESILVIQGPVESITVDTFTIYDQTIQVPSGHPVLSVTQIGDIVRIDGKRNPDETITLLNVTFINVLVLMNEGRVWRGDDCDMPPPDWAEDSAGVWFIQCNRPPQTGNTGSFNPSDNSNSSSNSGGRRNNRDDDDGGDDDD